MQHYLSAIMLMCGVMTFCGFSVAVRLHFQSSGMPSGMKLISAVSIVGIAVFAYIAATASRPPTVSVASTITILISAALFSWSIRTTRNRDFKLAFDRASPGSISRDGPFRYVRHPFYLSYIIFWAGASLGTLSLLMCAIAALLTALYVYAAMAEEVSFSRSELREPYEKYRQATGFIFPRLVGR